MRITLLTLLVVFFSFSSKSESFVQLQKQHTAAEIIESRSNKLHFKNSIEGFYLINKKTNHGDYTGVVVPGYFPNNHVGYPELPVLTRLIEIPHNSDVKVKITGYDVVSVNLNDHGFINDIFPSQESLFKNQNPDEVPFQRQEVVYENREFYDSETVVVNYKGIMRGVKVAQLVLSPFEYDIETNTLFVKTNIEAKLIFENADIAKTQRLKSDKYSPAFESAYNAIWNYSPPMNKNINTGYPLKYVIISDRMFEDVLQEFILWKTQKGFYVIEAYTDEIGGTKEEIKSFLQGLYDAGTANDPAPTYALFVGDIDQIPSFEIEGQFQQSHVSDMYYCEFDGEGDYIPDMFFGRFSANSEFELLPQIEKTIMFEKFLFPDPEYIRKSVLVSGHDNNFGPLHGNGQINYATSYYFNEARGVIDYTYFHPESNNQAEEIISQISSGVGFVNYTAHCSSTGWAGPNFRVNDVYSLQNSGKYFFSIGNCCQSNRFNSDNPCFGEALLRSPDRGAVVHIGGSDNTMWDEDFYWSTGIMQNINANPSYEETTTAVYDHLFHDNGEEPYTTAYQMVFRGNMEVMASTSNRDKYYWEIYHVLGDPSLKPYVGYTPNLEATHINSIPTGFTSININTVPGAYAAISIDSVLLDAAIADSEGNAFLEFDPIMETGLAKIVITKQFRAPYIENILVVPNDNEYDAMLKSINNPPNLIHVNHAVFHPEVEIMNLGIIPLENAYIGYAINNTDTVEIFWEDYLENLETATVTFDEISLDDGVYDFTAYIHSPNGEIDQFPENTEVSKTVTVFSGNVDIVDVVSPEDIVCNQSSFIPEIIIKNNDYYTLTSLLCSYVSNEVEDSFLWEGSLEPGEQTNIVFEENEFPHSFNTISFFVEEPNGGTNISENYSLNTEYYLVYPGEMFELSFKTDIYGFENTWELYDNIYEVVLYSGGPYPGNLEETYVYEWCLANGCYTFTVFDSYGDGMGGAPWNGDPGHVSIVNLDTDEIILDLEGDDENFTYSYSVSFCIENIMCPPNKLISLDAGNIIFSGEQPEGGTFSGEGIVGNVFNTQISGEGMFDITYSYHFPENEDPHECTFSVYVLDFDCPKDIVVTENDEMFVIEGYIPENGTFEGPGIVNENYFDPQISGPGTFEIKFSYSHPDYENDLYCYFTIEVSDGEGNFAEINRFEDIQVFPNPSEGIVNIINLSNSVDVSIFSITGELIRSFNNVSEQLSFDISHLSEGVYFIRITNDNSVVNKRLQLLSQ